MFTKLPAVLLGCLPFIVLNACSQSEQDGQNRSEAVTRPAERENRVSPTELVTANLDGNEVQLQYGSPRVKGRAIWGSLVPYDQVWRTGANEATTIQFSKDVIIDGQILKKDTYAVFTIPSAETWTVIFSLEEKQWGAFKYDSSEDALRLQVTPYRLDTVCEAMTFKLDDRGQGGLIRFNWEYLGFDIPFENIPEN